MATTKGLKKATPVLVVDRIEPILPFWKKLGLAPTVEVPDRALNDGRLAFVILAADSIELMFQTAASVRDDLGTAVIATDAIRGDPQQQILYVTVDRLEAIQDRLDGERLIMHRRTTFYGANELGYADPAGNVIIFAEHGTTST